MEHASKLVEVYNKRIKENDLNKKNIVFSFQVANVACSMSDQVEGIKLVRLAAMQIQHLSPQVC